MLGSRHTFAHSYKAVVERELALADWGAQNVGQKEKQNDSGRMQP